MKKLLRIILGITTLLLTIMLLLIGMAATGPGSALLVKTASGLVSGLKIEGFEGAVLSRSQIARLTLSDTQGSWLEADHLVISWRPVEALRGHWHITELSAQRIDVRRAPLPSRPEKKKRKARDVLLHLPWVAIDKLAVARLTLAPALTHGLAQNVTVNGTLLRDHKDAAQATLGVKTLEGIATHLELTATLSDRLDADVTFNEAPGGALGKLAAIDPERPLSLRFKVNGTPSAWSGGAMLREGETALLDLVADASGHDYHARWSGRMPSRLAEAHPPLASLGQSHRGEVTLSVGDEETVTIREAQATFDALALTTQGMLGAAASDFTVRLSIPSLAPFSALAHQPIAGVLVGDLTVKGPDAEGKLAADIGIHLQGGRIGERSISEAQLTADTKADAQAFRAKGWGDFTSKGGGQVNLDGIPWQLAYDAESHSARRIDAFHLTASRPSLTLTGEGTADLASGALDVAATLDGALAALPVNGLPNGDLRLSAKAKGDAAKLIFTMSGTVDHLAGLPAELDALLRGAVALDAKAELQPAKELRLQALQVKGDGIDLTAKGRYGLTDARYAATLDGEGRLPGAPALTLAFDAEGDRAQSRIKELRLYGTGLLVQASGALSHASRLFDGQATMAADDLSPYGHFAGMRLGGRLDAKARLSAGGGAQGVDADATGARLIVGGTSIAQLTLDARAADVRNRRGIKAALHGSGIRSGSIALNELTANAESALKDALAFTVQLQGAQGPTPLDADLRGSWTRDGARQAITLAKLDGHYATKPLHLAKPATLRAGSGEWWITPLEATMAGGRFTAGGGVRAGKAALDAAIAGLPLSAFLGQAGLNGTLAATVKVTGRAASPTANFTADAKAEAGRGAPPLSLHVVGSLAQRLEATTLLTMSGGEAKAEVALPARLSLAPPSVTLASAAPMKGTGTLSLALEELNPWLRRLGHEAGGRAAGSFTLGGTLAAPQAKGSLRLSDGRYDHLPSGVCLRALNASLDGSERNWRLASLSAKDTQGGSLSGSGQGSFALSAPLTADLAMHKLRLFCRGMATGEVDGALHARGTLAQAELGGALRLGPMAINLPGGGESRIPEIPVVRKGERPVDHSAPAAGSRSIALAIDVSVPDRVFVRGRGLDAELEGKLHVGGSAAEPDVTGRLRTKRGRFDLLDRPMALTKAELQFGGSIPPSPFLSVEATTKVEDVTITVALSGPAQKPELTLSSTPALPQDELLSRLLFGRDVKSISAFQAIQLAQSVAALSGKSSGPGLLDQARSALGVDTLTVDQGTNSGTTVGAGKYISDKVYVGVAQGASPEDRKVTTEIEVTPSVSAGTSTDAEGHAGASLQWKWDY